MPLYDFRCDACGQASTLLLKMTDSAACPACGSTKMTKQFAPFAISTGSPGVPQAGQAPSGQRSAGGHVHTAACAGGCGAGAKADALIKKYLD